MHYRDVIVVLAVDTMFIVSLSIRCYEFFDSQCKLLFTQHQQGFIFSAVYT